MVINLLRGCAKTSGWMDLVGYAYILPNGLARSISHNRSRRWRSHAAVWIFVSALIVVLDDALAVEPTPSRNQGGDGIPVSAVPTFDCADVIGKVFDDSNLNGYQDEAEVGIPSVKLVTTQGLEARTDQNGRFHITCALSPNPDRGSNFIIKLDARSLPIGYRLTTENPRVVRATPGKVLKFDFGAAIHRRVRLDLADAVFESNSSQIRKQWLSHVDLLINRLEEGPAVLCLAYMADFEELTLVTERLLAIKKEINQRWADLDCCYKLDIETRIIWRGRTSTD